MQDMIMESGRSRAAIDEYLLNFGDLNLKKQILDILYHPQEGEEELWGPENGREEEEEDDQSLEIISLSRGDYVRADFVAV